MAKNRGLTRAKFMSVTFSIVAILLSALYADKIAKAQAALQPIYSSDHITNVTWSSDSRMLVFQDTVIINEQSVDRGVITQSPTWNTYALATGQISKFSVWPLQPSLSSSQQTTFGIATLKGQIAFVFVSPNQRFIVYPTRISENGCDPASETGCSWILALGDLQTGHNTTLGDAFMDDFESFTSNYDVKWSADSNAFVINTTFYGGTQHVHYVTNYKSALTNTSVVSLEKALAPIPPYIAYDISVDGSQVLLSVGSNRQLFLWNAKDASKNQKTTQQDIIEAAFGSSSQVLLVNPQGLIAYDLVSGNTTIINSQIGSLVIDQAWISPNKNKIALHHTGDQDTGALYVINAR